MMENKLLKLLLLAALAAVAPAAPTNLGVAALVQKLPACSLGNGYDADKDGVIDSGCPGTDHFSTQGTGYAVHLKDCTRAGTAEQFTDAVADSSTAVRIPSGSNFLSGQFRCLTTPAAGTYTIKVLARTLSASKTRFWMGDNTPWLITASPTVATSTALFGGMQQLTYSWFTLSNTVISAGAQIALYPVMDDSLEAVCVYMDTNANAIPACPAGAVPPVPDYVMLLINSGITVDGALTDNDWGNANVITVGACSVKFLRENLATDKIYFGATCTDTDLKSTATSADDATIPADDNFEFALKSGVGNALDSTTWKTIVNISSTVAIWDANYPAGVATTAYAGSCSAAKSITGTLNNGPTDTSWTIEGVCNMGFNPAVDEVGKLHVQFFDRDNTGDSSASWRSAAPDNPQTWGYVRYSNTVVPAPPPETVAPVLGAITFPSVLNTSINVRFACTDSGSGCATATVDYDTNSGVPYASNQMCSITGTNPNFIVDCVVTGLTTGTTYFFRGNAVDGVGNAANTVENNISTLTGAVVFLDNIACAGNYRITTRNCTGTDGSSFISLTNALAGRSVGDTINIRSGTWAGAQGSAFPQGVLGRPITIQGYLAENPTVRHLGGNNGGGDFSLNFYKIQNLVVNCANSPTFPIDGIRALANSTITNVEVTNCAHQGISDSHQTVHTNLNVHHNGTANCPYGPFDTRCHGVYTSAGTGNTFDGGEFHHNAGQGIQCYLHCGPNAVIKNLKLYNNGTYGSFIGYDPGVTIFNVVAYNNGNYGLWMNSQGTLSHITTYGNGAAGIAAGTTTGITIQNSLVLGSIVDTHGLGYTGITNIQAANSTHAAHFANALADDFRLCRQLANPGATCPSAQSAAIDAGSTIAGVPTDILGIARPQPPGGLVDLGAYESVGTVVPWTPPTADVTDNFTRANGGLGANWTTRTGHTAPLIVSNGAQAGLVDVNSSALYNAFAAPANQWLQWTVSNIEVNQIQRGLLRTAADGTVTSYECVANAFVGTADINERTAGSGAELNSIAVTWADGDVIYCEVVGSVITMRRNGTVILNAVDTTITSGMLGMGFVTSTPLGSNIIDTWSGGDFIP